ncbi:MAG: sigma-70 family RNA polymerase sigma factor [Planctomycetia bacterium]|nr:sigma-70 family RNA polymerase sigma factor [Planctomycetia bacterium]
MNNGQAVASEWMWEILLRYEGDLLRYAQRIVGDQEQARDVVQETFLKLWRQDRAQLDGHLVEWLYTVCRNHAVDVRRKEQRMHTLAEESWAIHESADPCPGALAERRDSAAQVLDLVDRLPANQQEVIRLKFQGGLSYREISRVTGLTVSHVGVLLHTGLKTIRTKLCPSTT